MIKYTYKNTLLVVEIKELYSYINFIGFFLSLSVMQ